jgi:hypothetical protein
MTADGYLTVNRAESADRLNRNERTIQRHLQHAIDAKLLDRVRRGQKGVYSRYRAMLPDIQRDIQGDDDSHPDDDGDSEITTTDRHPETPVRVTEGVPHLERPSSSGEPSTIGAVDDGEARDDADSLVTADGQHVTPDGDARQQQPGMRGRGATEPQGDDLAISGRNNLAR